MTNGPGGINTIPLMAGVSLILVFLVVDGDTVVVSPVVEEDGPESGG